MTEQPGGKRHADDADQRQRPVLRHQVAHPIAFEIDPAGDDEEIPHGVDVGEQLHRLGHIGNGRGKAGQNDGRHQEHEHAQQTLLLGHGDGRDHQPDAGGGEQEKKQPDSQRQHAAHKRHAEPEYGDDGDKSGLQPTDDETWQRLAQQNFHRTQGRDQQLIEGAHLAFARHRQPGDQQGDHESEQSHDARKNEPARQQIGVEPGANFQPRRRAAPAVLRSPLLIESEQHTIGIVQRQRCGVGVSAIDQQLHRGRLMPQQIAGEVRADVQHQQRILVVDQRGDLRIVGDVGHLAKGVRAGKARDQFARGVARVFVVNRIRNVVEVEAGGIAEHQQLNERRADQHRAAGRVAQQHEQFLDDECNDAAPHGSVQSLVRFAPGNAHEYRPHHHERGAVAQNHRPDITRQKHGLQNGDVIARGDQMREKLHHRRHGVDVENEPRQNEGRQEGDDDRHQRGDELAVGQGGNQQPHRQRHQQEQRRAQHQQPQTADQRHGEQPHRHGHRQRHAPHAEHEIRNQFAQQNFRHGHRAGHERFHGAALAFSRDDQRSEQGADQGHDDRNQPRHQKVAAAHRRVEPDARLHADGQEQGLALPLGFELQPVLPDALQIALHDAGVVGVHAVHPHCHGSRAAGERQPGEVAPQPDDAVHLAGHQRMTSSGDVGVGRRCEVRRLL